MYYIIATFKVLTFPPALFFDSLILKLNPVCFQIYLQICCKQLTFILYFTLQHSKIPLVKITKIAAKVCFLCLQKCEQEVTTFMIERVHKLVEKELNFNRFCEEFVTTVESCSKNLTKVSKKFYGLHCSILTPDKATHSKFFEL